MKTLLAPLMLALALLAGQDAVLASEPVQLAQAKSAPIDINRAKADELMTLEGIGDARATAIIKGRPYARKDELVQKKIIPESVCNC
jgi:competence protein ComEA